MRFFLFAVLTFIFSENIFCQTVCPVSSFGKTSERFFSLLQTNEVIAKNDTLNELILDLANPTLTDSIIERKKQHHKIFGVGLLIHVFGGFNWRAIEMKKQKFVGTIIRNTKSGKERYTEYDINFDLTFHLHKYLLQQFIAYDLQKEIGRQDYRKGNYLKDYSAPPFMRDTNSIDINLYKLHCELTPADNYREQLNENFYPTIRDGKELKDHPNFGTEFPSMGFYGAWCLDCNHSCHPEIHPYEWIWWMHTTENDSTKNREWLIGLFHESSNRMKRWSRSPETGSFTIPFVMENAMDENRILKINIEHLVYGEFNSKEKQKLKPQTGFSSSEKNLPVIFQVGAKAIRAEIQFSDSLSSGAITYSFTDLNYDADKNILSGYLNFYTSAKEVYTTRISFLQN